MRPGDCLPLTSVESGLVTSDSLIDLGLGSRSRCGRLSTPERHWPRSAPSCRSRVRMARRGAESVGETSEPLPVLVSSTCPSRTLQFEVRDERGNLIGVVDFAWPEFGLLGEFDGKIKYGRLLKPGQDPGDVGLRGEEERGPPARDHRGSGPHPLHLGRPRPAPGHGRARAPDAAPGTDRLAALSARHCLPAKLLTSPPLQRMRKWQVSQGPLVKPSGRRQPALSPCWC